MSTAEDVQLRCRSRLQGIIKEKPCGTRVLEVRCKDKWCADRRAGEVVFHEFDLKSGRLVNTKKYRDPISVSRNGKVASK